NLKPERVEWPRMDQRERYRRALLGLASGDALGTTVEFRAPAMFEKLQGIVGGGPFCLAPGEWTDDTSMALCLAESLIEKRAFDTIDQLERYTRWYRDAHLSCNGKVFDVGMTVRAALARFAQKREPYCGSTDPETAGNGSLMRLAPVPLHLRVIQHKRSSDPAKVRGRRMGHERQWTRVAIWAL